MRDRFQPRWRRAIALLLVVLCPPATAQVVISEFLASNVNGLEDEDDKREDWIELENTSASPVSLAGWHLTDDPLNLRAWPLPAWTLNAGNRLVVFASGQDRRPAQAVAGQDNAGTITQPRLHTNFKISAAAGGNLLLTRDLPGGGVSVVSAYTNLVKQLPDISFGSSRVLTTLAAAGTAARALVPAAGNGGDALGDTWRGGTANEPFDDSSWTAGTLGAGVAGTATPVASANLKLRLNASSSAGLGDDGSGAGHPAANTSGTTIWMPSATDTAAPALLRRGAMQFVAGSSSQMTVPAHADFDGSSGTIGFWMKSAGMSGGGKEGAMLWDRRTSSGMVIVLNADGRLFAQPTGGGSSFYSTVTVNDDRWHHVALVFNRAAGGVDTFYVDGVARGSVTHGTAWSWPASQQIELGRSHDPYWYKYNGLLDDVRFYNAALSGAQLSQIVSGADEDVEPVDIGLSLASALPGHAGAFLRVPFTLESPSAHTGLRLTTRANDGFIAWVNGTQVDAFQAPVPAAFNALATAAGHPGRLRSVEFVPAPGLLRAGGNVLALHALNSSTSDPNLLALPVLEGWVSNGGDYLLSNTPGAVNTGVRTAVGPLIEDVTGSEDFPVARPAGGPGSAPLVVTATVKPSLRPLAAVNPVQLAYRVMFAAETVVNMSSAGGGVYTASIPTTGLGAGQMLRWRVIATDNTGVQATAPDFAVPASSDQYHGTVALDGVSTQLPVYHVFAEGWTIGNSHPIDQNNVGGRAAFYANGELYDNVFIRIKGDTTRTLYKRSHRVDFNRSHQFKWAAGQSRLRELALNAEYVDPSYSRQFLSFWMHRESGTGAPNHFPVRCQMNGAFWQLAFHTETADSELLEYMGLDPNGALYVSVGQMSGAAGEKQTRPAEGTGDMSAFVTAVTHADPATRRNNVLDQIDVPAVVNYLAVARLAQEGDDIWANMTIHRDSDNTGEWRVIPFDNNLSWGQLYWADYPTWNSVVHGDNDNNKSHPFYGNSQCQTTAYATGRYNRFYEAIMSVPETREMYRRRLRTIMDDYLQAPGTVNPRLEAFLDAHVARIAPEAALDRAQWGWSPSSGPYGLGNDDLATGVSELKTLFLTPRRNHLFNTHTSTVNVGIANGNSAGIPAAQPTNAVVTIAAYDANPAGSTTQDQEYMRLDNANAFAVDVSGWRLAGGVDFTLRGGTVIPAGGSVFVSRNPRAFRLRSVSPKGGEGRFVTGPYAGQISARGETIQLLNLATSVVASVTTPAAPTAAQLALRVTELQYHPANPSPTEALALPNVTDSDFEYIELTNTGATTLSLGGARFARGIDFTFPAGTNLAAGARFVLVASAPAFRLRHGPSPVVAGTFLGNLDNAGETIQLLDASGEVVLDFTYHDDWFPPTDGSGRALVARASSPDHALYDSPLNWAISGAASGSPGAADASFAHVYEGWRWDHFTAGQMPTLLDPNLPAATGQDPDGDQRVNLAEYAFGGQPTAAGADAPAAGALVDVSGQKHLAVTFTRRAGTLDLLYSLETADNPAGPWFPLDAVEQTPAVPAGDGLETVTWRDTAPLSTSTRLVRVRVDKF